MEPKPEQQNQPPAVNPEPKPITQPPISPPVSADTANEFNNDSRPIGVYDPAVPGVVVGGASAPSSVKKTAFFELYKKKSLLILVTAGLILLGGGAAAYFGYYLPNKPENLWKTALERTGKGYEKVSEYIVKQAKSDSNGASINGSFKISGDFAADGSFQGNSDGTNSQLTGNLSTSGLKVGLDFRTLKSATGTPDVYIKVTGLQGLGDLFGAAGPDYQSFLNGVDGSWYFIDHSLFDQFVEGGASNFQISQKDYSDFLKAISGPSKTYIFNADNNQSALVVKQQIGKEKIGDRNTYRYKVGINKDNLKKYNDALCESLKDTKIFKLISGPDQASSLKDCKDTADIDSIKETDSADVWVDTRTKLIHKIRFTQKDNNSDYFDIGQDYQGGDILPLFMDMRSKKSGSDSKFRVDMSLDMKSNKLSIKADYSDKGSSGSATNTGTFDMSITPNKSPIKVEKPANPKNLIQLLNDLGFGELFSDLQLSAKDTERKTDIKTLQGHIEAYWATSGYYPTLANLNDQTWRRNNLSDFDPESLKDPNATSNKLVANPTAKAYAYQAAPAGCDNKAKKCTSYKLTAILDNGENYTEVSLEYDIPLPVITQ